MTAEIALLNRRAMAFAADSAVTISDGKNSKIYNSAEKIFELSMKSPIGLMLYNSMDFAGTPLDILARVFRSKNDREFATIEDACKSFLIFLKSFKRTSADEEEHLDLILSKEAREIVKEYEDEQMDSVIAAYRARKDTDQINIIDINRSVLIQILQRHAEAHRQQRLANFTKQSFCR